MLKWAVVILASVFVTLSQPQPVTAVPLSASFAAGSPASESNVERVWYRYGPRFYYRPYYGHRHYYRPYYGYWRPRYHYWRPYYYGYYGPAYRPYYYSYYRPWYRHYRYW
jgi:hypothetical protein